jgi:EAL domain-containing protein (putative c-di-GMP-specific phosphodiesterase class I)
VLRSVCAQLKRFSFGNGDEFSISVNVSGDWFRQAGFVQAFAAEMVATATEPRRLSVEVAEKAIAGDANASTATLRELALLGVGLAIDDFGTGPSALSDMRHLPVADLKIDRSFIDGIVASRSDEAIARTIVTLAHSLGMRVIAEGVETPEQAQKLRALGSDRLQGYFISRPLPAADFERFACTFGSLRLAA